MLCMPFFNTANITFGCTYNLNLLSHILFFCPNIKFFMVTFVCVSVWKPGHLQVWGSSGGEQKLDAGVGGE